MACGGESSSAVVDQAAVVERGAERDGLDGDAAAQKVRDVHLLAEAARAEREAVVDPPPLVSDSRARFLRRGALARLWMTEVFEPSHDVDAIPSDDPIYLRALASPLHVRPRLYRLCQIVVVPSGFDDDREGRFAKAEDPSWQAVARDRAAAVANRLRRYVTPADPEACALMAKLMRFEPKDDGTVALRVESSAFDLDACAKLDDAGACVERQFAQEWIDAVRPHTAPGFVPPFSSRFGVHVVFVLEVLPPAAADDPEVIASTKAAILPPWRAAAYDETLDRLRQKWSVKVTVGADP